MCSVRTPDRSGANCHHIATGKCLADSETDGLFAREALAHHAVAERSFAAEVEGWGETDNHTAEEAVVASTSMYSHELLIENELVEVVELPGLDSADQIISFQMFSRAETHGNIYPSTPRWLFMMAGFTSGHLGYDSTDKNLSIKSNVSMFTGFACVVSFLPPDHSSCILE